MGVDRALNIFDYFLMNYSSWLESCEFMKLLCKNVHQHDRYTVHYQKPLPANEI